MHHFIWSHIISFIHHPLLLIGDEILAINGKSLQGLSHDDAINEFRAIKNGQVILQVAKREVLPLVQKGYKYNSSIDLT